MGQCTGGGDPWPYWIVSTANTTTTGGAWPYWCSQTTTTNTGNTIWFQWCGQQLGQMGNQPQAAMQPPATAEELAAAQLARAEADARYAAAEKARLAAEARAEALLLENLSLKQRQQYEKDKHFVIERGDRRYRIRRGRSANVDVIGKDGKITHRLCAYPNAQLPDSDTMLAQKLMLENNEDDFVRVAIRHHAHEQAAVLAPMH